MSTAVYFDPYKLPPAAAGAAGMAGVLALLVHIVFFALLYVSFSWQMQSSQGVEVEIWDSLPSSEPVAQPPEQPPAEVQVKPAAPKVETAPPAPAKAEIEFKDRKKKRKEEKLSAEGLKQRKLAEKQAEQAERRMEELERQIQARTLAQQKAQAEAAAASGKVVDEYIGKIRGKIKRWIVLPPGVPHNIEAKFNVTLLPGGEVLNAVLVKSSGNAAYDNAVERAILKAQPLPLPPAEQNLFSKFRDLHLKFSPAESGR